MAYFTRTENGVVSVVPQADAMGEANTAMRDHSHVWEMSAGSGRYDIQYKDGRHVVIQRHEGDAPSEEPREWHGTRSTFHHLHRFDEDNRARCNRSIKPNRNPREGTGEWGVWKSKRSEVESDIYTFCPKCDALP